MITDNGKFDVVSIDRKNWEGFLTINHEPHCVAYGIMFRGANNGLYQHVDLKVVEVIHFIARNYLCLNEIKTKNNKVKINDTYKIKIDDYNEAVLFMLNYRQIPFPIIRGIKLNGNKKSVEEYGYLSKKVLGFRDGILFCYVTEEGCLETYKKEVNGSYTVKAYQAVLSDKDVIFNIEGTKYKLKVVEGAFFDEKKTKISSVEIAFDPLNHRDYEFAANNPRIYRCVTEHVKSYQLTAMEISDYMHMKYIPDSLLYSLILRYDIEKI